MRVSRYFRIKEEEGGAMKALIKIIEFLLTVIGFLVALGMLLYILAFHKDRSETVQS